MDSVRAASEVVRSVITYLIILWLCRFMHSCLGCCILASCLAVFVDKLESYGHLSSPGPRPARLEGDIGELGYSWSTCGDYQVWQGFAECFDNGLSSSWLSLWFGSMLQLGVRLTSVGGMIQ